MATVVLYPAIKPNCISSNFLTLPSLTLGNEIKPFNAHYKAFGVQTTQTLAQNS